MNIEHKCIYGELKLSGLHGAHFTIEHLIPVSKGGVDDLSNVNVFIFPLVLLTINLADDCFFKKKKYGLFN